MPELAIYNNNCNGVFGLNGYDENSATYALGWVLTKSPNLLRAFIKRCVGELESLNLDRVLIDLQKSGKDRGYTDLELKQHGVFHIIVEAKKYWSLPSKAQLTKYTERFSKQSQHFDRSNQVLVTISAASVEYANRNQSDEISGYSIIHQSWFDLTNIIKSARSATKSFEEKLWLRELATHIKGYNTMTAPTDNRAYCVVLSRDEIVEGSGYTWVDVITKDQSYFHPVGGNGWPVSPPNYVAFRKSGKLMSVHHVNSYEVADDLKSINENWPNTTSDHFIYKLGPAMKPEKPLKNGNLFASQRIWCALDTLLSGEYESIAEARDETKRRLSEA